MVAGSSGCATASPGCRVTSATIESRRGRQMAVLSDGDRNSRTNGKRSPYKPDRELVIVR